MKLQNLTVIFVIVIIPVILLVSLYITNGLKTIKYQAIYDSGLLTATHDAIYAFELNTTNDAYSDNAETKRNILKSSVKAFERSLCNTCGISSYNTKEIEEYIPAIMFGMYDGFYMYAPSLNSNGTYEHSLKNYVYYSEEINGIIIRYSLDSYITVSGDFGEGYETKEGYLMVLDGSTRDGNKYKNIAIHSDDNDDSAIKYYQEAYKFTTWFNDKVLAKIDANYFKINANNDPEDENSAFTKHKREVMKNKIEQVLNSTITAYSNRTTNTTVYKMPKLNVYDWEKIYSNISMVTFFQGKNIGLTNYNGYCVLNSTNSNEYVNPNLMYFINGGTYHDIRCTDMEGISNSSNGYRIGAFQKTKTETTNNAGETTYSYIYKHYENACYNCINGQISSNASVYDYVRDSETSDIVKSSYFTSLARERYNTVKLLETEKDEETITKEFNVKWNGPANKRPTTYTINIIQNDENYRTYEYENSVSQVTLRLPKNANKTTIRYGFEANAGKEWTPNISGNKITFTYNPQTKKYDIFVIIADNDNLYNKRPEAITIGMEDQDTKEIKEYKNVKLDSSVFRVTFNLPESIYMPKIIENINEYGYTSIINETTIALRFNLKVARWVMDGTSIKGETSDGTLLQTVNLGDYIIYNDDYVNSPIYIPINIYQRSVKVSDQYLKEANWRIIGVENNQLLIAADDNTPNVGILYTNSGTYAYGYYKGMDYLNSWAKIYQTNKYADDARIIKVDDINNLIHSFGYNYVTYGNDQNKLPDPVLFSTEEEGENYLCDRHNNTKCYKVEEKLFDLLFPKNFDYYWINKKYENGYYSAGDLKIDEPEAKFLYGLYAAHLKEFGNNTYRFARLRPVVRLKNDIIIYGSGQTREDGSSVYNIKN